MFAYSPKSVILTGVACLALAGCGGSDDGMTGMASGATASSPLDQPFQLKDGEPLDVGALLTAMDMEGALEYGSSTFDEKLGATVLTDVTSPMDENMTIGRVELYGVDADTLNSLSSGNAMEKMQSLFAKIRVFDYQNSVDIYPTDLSGDEPTFFMQDEASALTGSISFAGLELNELQIQSPGEEVLENATEEQSFAMIA
ncbi:MAG: hypothetical protein AAF723_07430, partial [Pseudomonadota bacterium]